MLLSTIMHSQVLIYVMQGRPGLFSSKPPRPSRILHSSAVDDLFHRTIFYKSCSELPRHPVVYILSFLLQNTATFYKKRAVALALAVWRWKLPQSPYLKQRLGENSRRVAQPGTVVWRRRARCSPSRGRGMLKIADKQRYPKVPFIIEPTLNADNLRDYVLLLGHFGVRPIWFLYFQCRIFWCQF